MSSNRAFTLIELLVVIAIIAILAAILFPVFANAKQRAWQNRCLNNQKQLASAFQQYCSDFDGTMPDLVDWPNWCGSEGVLSSQGADPKQGVLWTYTRNESLFFCPSDRGIEAAKKRYLDKTKYPDGYLLSYSVNCKLHRIKFDSEVGFRAPQVLLLIHEDREAINDGFFAYNSGRDIPDDVHYDGTTACYCDGHARWYPHKELMRQLKSGHWDPRYCGSDE